jgi:menaquinol-cytochrome c reductase iron-sulfur subunit
MKHHTGFQADTPTRRSLYSALTFGLGSLLGAALGVPAEIYLLAGPRTKKKKETFFQASDLRQLEVGRPQRVTFERTRIDGWRTLQEKAIAWVVRSPDEKVVAYSPQCTHLGCAYHWEDETNQFVCPCHASRFSIDGRVLGGPAARPLDRYIVCVENSKVMIGSKIFKV